MSDNGSAGDYALRLGDAGKRYVKYEDVPTLIGFAKRFGARSQRGQLWAVRHLDLEVAHGETVGIIGRNGAGKTTTLQMLAGVTAPTEGVVAVRGRVSPLIAVGVGFHQELTGRENVYVNGTVLGMTRREIDRLFDSIVDFAELERFIDTPVKFYSSGMLVRLGFSVAIAARPDVLLVDEVLAVGDLPFQIKCFERIAEIRASGTSTVVVSHNLNAVRRLCSRVMVIDRGVPRFVGSTAEGISHYLEILDEQTGDAAIARDAAIRIVRAELLDASGRPTVHLAGGEEAVFRVEIEALRALTHPYPVFALTIHSDTGLLIYQEGTFEGEILAEGRRFEAGERLLCEMRFPARFPSGTYSAAAQISWSTAEADIKTTQSFLFYVDGRNPLLFGVADIGATFTVTDDAGARTDRGSSLAASPSTED
ncbi:MAG TPA: ABC transporter ATP-binding protein [Actinomycetota bacterium]|nr:ABC transporter ATP-binding protein [Actinomycetota bacterium]